MHHVIFEGLPAAGKSETLSLLARFYPQNVVVLPELVKEVAIREEIDIFSQRERLTQAIVAEIPRRKEQVQRAIAFWLEDGVVPRTGGQTVTYETLKTIIAYWLTNTDICDPLPGAVKGACDGGAACAPCGNK